MQTMQQTRMHKASEPTRWLLSRPRRSEYNTPRGKQHPCLIYGAMIVRVGKTKHSFAINAKHIYLGLLPSPLPKTDNQYNYI